MSRTLSLSTSAFSASVFTPVKLSGTEYINELFAYQLILKTPDLEGHQFYQQYGSKSPAANVDLTSWLGQSLTVNIELDGKEISFSEVNNTFRQHFTKTVGKGVRHISGIITSAQYLYNQGRSSYYLVKLSPFLQAATLRRNHRIQQDKTPIEIIEELLTNYPGLTEKRLEEQRQNRYPVRDYQTQYSETDFAFFIRLCAEWGINYWFEHSADGHILILSDEPQNHHSLPSEAYHQISYYPQGHKIEEEYLHEFSIVAQAVSGAFTSTDYDYARASAELSDSTHNTQPYPEAQKSGTATTGSTPEETAPQKSEIYDYAADVVQPEAGPNQESNDAIGEQILRNQWNLERLQQQHLTASAFGHIRGMAAGYTFELKKHPSTLANIQWTITRTELLIMDLAEESQRKDSGLPSLLTVAGGDSKHTEPFYTAIQSKLDKLTGSNNQQWLIECSAGLIPANIPIRPETIQKPQGTLQNALVVGETEAGSIYTDSYGRIKVQFYWDRYGQKDQNSSCWVRVNQPWAGNQMGAVFTPRIGQEVLIGYINNDPDLPVCIGKVNNSDNMPPWALAQNKALSGFRSRELPKGNSAGRSNHLVFDDTEKHIQTQLKSDHAHSQLSLGDIARIDTTKGRDDVRGQGFELRTDDWGAARAAKGLYLTTYPREEAKSSQMDAFEAQQLLEEAKELVNQLSNLANKHQADSLTAANQLDMFSKIAKSELPIHPGSLNRDLPSSLKQINEINALKGILPDGLPNQVKAEATEKVLNNLAKQEIIPPVKPIVNAGELHYNAVMDTYREQLKAYEKNPFDKAKEKVKELDQITDQKEKIDKLLNDQGIKDIFSSLSAEGKSYSQLQQEVSAHSPEGFEQNILLGAGQAGVAFVTPKEMHYYSEQNFTLTSGLDLNTSVGNSWLSSVGNRMSLFAAQDIKLYSGKGKIEIQAQHNDLDLIAEKVVKIISAQDKIEIAAKKEILLTSGDAYIRIKGGNIDIHAPGKVEQKGVIHSLKGPAQIDYPLPEFYEGETEFKLALHDDQLEPVPHATYRVIFEDGSEREGILDGEGKATIDNPPTNTAEVIFGYSIDEPTLPTADMFPNNDYSEAGIEQAAQAIKEEFGFDGDLAEFIDSVFVKDSEMELLKTKLKEEG